MSQQIRNILLIEDEPITKEIYQFLLSKDDKKDVIEYRIVHVNDMDSAKSALELSVLPKSVDKYQAILLDLKLEPTIEWTLDNGFRNIDYLKKNYSKIPIIAISSIERNEKYNLDFEIGRRGVDTTLLKKSGYSSKWKKIINDVILVSIKENQTTKSTQTKETKRQEEIEGLLAAINLIKNNSKKDKEKIDLLKKLKSISSQYLNYSNIINRQQHIRIINSETNKYFNDDDSVNEKELIEAYQIIEGYELAFGNSKNINLPSISTEILNQKYLKHNIQFGVKISNVSFPNLLFFDELKWYLQPQINVVLGENGFGKSFLLRIIAALCQDDTIVLKNDLFHKKKYFEESITIGLNIGEEAKAIIYDKNILNNEDIGIIPLLAINSHRFFTSQVRSFSGQVADITEKGANNFLWNQTEEGRFNNFLMLLHEFYQGEIDKISKSLHKGGNFLFYNKEIEPQIKERINKNFQKHPCVIMFKNVMKTLSENDSFEFHSFKKLNAGTLDIQIKTDNSNGETISIQQASSGQQSILAIFGLVYDFLYRLNLRKKKLDNTYMNDDITKEQGIVIIDEIDAHLHPKWQRKIVNLLRDTFPNVQFILISHSPLVVAGCRDEEVVKLERKNNRKLGLRQYQRGFVGELISNVFESVFDLEDFTDETFYRIEKEWFEKSFDFRIEFRTALETLPRTPKQRKLLRDHPDFLQYCEAQEAINRFDFSNKVYKENKELRKEIEMLKKELKSKKNKNTGKYIPK